jgi:hypothetical protein
MNFVLNYKLRDSFRSFELRRSIIEYELILLLLLLLRRDSERILSSATSSRTLFPRLRVPRGEQEVEKDQKLSWRDLWEVDVAEVMREEVMREETIAQDTERAING